VAGLVVALALASGLAGRALVGASLVGPLALGVASPRSRGFAKKTARLAGTPVRHVLLPVFLAGAGLRTDLRALTPDLWLVGGAVVLGLTAAKLAAGYAASRALGYPPGRARALGGLLQCGGVVTMVIALGALGEGLITTELHALLTVVALVSTAITGPLLGAARPAQHAAPAPG